MKVVCPNNKSHKRFTVTAHVTERWLVDEGGLVVEIVPGESEVIHRPDADDLFECVDCDCDAVSTWDNQ